MELNDSDHLKKKILDPQSLTNSGVLRKCPTWDIIPTSLFESMTDIFRLSWNLQNTDLRAREEENESWIMESIRVGLTLRTQETVPDPT